MCHYNIGRNFHKHECKEESPNSGIVAIGRHLQFFLETEEFGVPDISSVEICCEVEHAKHGHHSHVDFASDPGIKCLVVFC